MRKGSQKPMRSDKYQYVILEVLCTYDYLCSFDNSQSIYTQLNPFYYNEQVMELEDRLKERFWKIAESILTDKQKAVLNLYKDGYTQMEIAKILGVNQSSITKSLNGNTDYSRKTRNNSKSYGGLIKKLRKFMAEDPEIQKLLTEINELKEERL